MSRNRPINRRPFRRPPWRKNKTRPTRWNAVTTGADETAIAVALPVTPETGVGTAPLITLVSGQVDVEPWADDQEVTVDRIVGTICFYGTYIVDTTSTQLTAKFPLIKAGIVLNEELSFDVTDTVERNLWDQEDLEDTEWMWLNMGMPTLTQASVQQVATNGGAPIANGVYVFGREIPVDIRNRRKIGQSDELALYATWVSPKAGFNISMDAYVDLRVILMSR